MKYKIEKLKFSKKKIAKAVVSHLLSIRDICDDMIEQNRKTLLTAKGHEEFQLSVTSLSLLLCMYIKKTTKCNSLDFDYESLSELICFYEFYLGKERVRFLGIYFVPKEESKICVDEKEAKFMLKRLKAMMKEIGSILKLVENSCGEAENRSTKMMVGDLINRYNILHIAILVEYPHLVSNKMMRQMVDDHLKFRETSDR